MIRATLIDTPDAYKVRLSNYPQQISQSVPVCLRQMLVQYNIVCKEQKQMLGLFGFLVVAQIEAALICKVHNLEPVIPQHYKEDVYMGESLRYFHYPDYIIEAIRHSIRSWKMSVDLEIFSNNIDELDELLEIYADDIASEIEISTWNSSKLKN